MMNVLKSILTNIADNPKPSLPCRDRKEAVPKEWAIAGDNSHAVESHFCNVSSSDGRAATFLIGEVSASGGRARALVDLIQSTVRSADQKAAALQINRVLYEQDHYAAMFWSQFDPEPTLLHFINPAHLPPLLFK